MSDSYFKIKAGSGTYNFLDKIYNRFITHTLITDNNETIDRFITYDSIMNELIALGDISSFEEAKYRLTGGENPNQVMLDIIDRDNETKTVLWSLRTKIEEYIEDDKFKRFYE